jgi:cell division septal protein FtsQ
VRILFFFLALAWLGSGYWLVSDPRFRVARVEARGAHYLAPETVNAAVAAQGQSIFQISSRSALDRVLALGIPRDATIIYRLPNVVVVVLRERTSANGWKVGDTTFGISEDGVILGPTDETTQRLVVEDRRGLRVRPGDRVAPAVLHEADYLVQTLPIAISTSPSTIDYSDELGVVIEMPNRTRIIVGDDQKLDQKIAALSPAWRAAVSQNPPASVVDLRVPSRPIIRGAVQ